MMNNKRFWIVLVAILVLVNVISLGFLWFGRYKHEKHSFRDEKPNTEQMIKKKLNLSDEQLRQFKSERKRHFRQVRPLESELRDLKKQLFEMNVDGISEVDISPKLSEIRQVQGEIDSLTYSHFATLRSYCHEDQIEDFNMMLKHMLRRGFKNEMDPELRRKERRQRAR
jgi:hypothetical protein